MAARPILSAIFFLSVSWLPVLCAGCEVEDVAVYKVTLHMLWSEERFPKDYPLHRPKAQWSQVFGQSHNSSYHLYQLGDIAPASVRQFAQFGDLAELIELGDEEPRVYDQFSAPALGKGEGHTENMVFLDGAHSLVSLISRMVPSPDWFIGVDSLNLCVDSSWIELITLELDPLDAGAASGLTFTAPRWETVPPGAVTRHRPRSPGHPAAGFYYPDLKELPAIATVEFSKVKEYSTIELNNLARKELKTKLKNQEPEKDALKGKPKLDRDESDEETFEEYMTTRNYMDQLMELEQDPVGTPRPNVADNNVEIVTKSPVKITTTTEPEFGTKLNSMDDVVMAVANGRKLGLGKHLPRHFRSRLHHAVNKLTANDCQVSPWSAWTPCSATCGFGDQFRTRHVLRAPTLGGRECPELTERAHCGNANSCYDMQYFDWQA